MIIPVSVAPRTLPPLPPGLARLAHGELALVELQGALDVEAPTPGERDGRAVGTLALDDATGRATLRIGHHLLEGKVAALPKPLAVLLRSRAAAGSGRAAGGGGGSGSGDSDGDDGGGRDDDAMDTDGGAGDVAAAGARAPTVGWDVVAVVKKKIVFADRPMPIVGKRA